MARATAKVAKVMQKRSTMVMESNPTSNPLISSRAFLGDWSYLASQAAGSFHSLFHFSVILYRRVKSTRRTVEVRANWGKKPPATTVIPEMRHMSSVSACVRTGGFQARRWRPP